MLKVKGQIVSAVGISPKGVSFKVMIPDLGDVFRIFVPVEKSNSTITGLKMSDAVDVTINRFFPRKNEVGLDLGGIDVIKK